MSYSQGKAACSERELSKMTVSQIKELAAKAGYSVTATKKAEIIRQFINQQEER